VYRPTNFLCVIDHYEPQSRFARLWLDRIALRAIVYRASREYGLTIALRARDTDRKTDCDFYNIDAPAANTGKFKLIHQVAAGAASKQADQIVSCQLLDIAYSL